MTKKLLVLSVCILTTVCAFAQHETKRPFDRENLYEKETKSDVFSFREHAKPEVRTGRVPISIRQSNAVRHRLDSAIITGSNRYRFEYDSNGNPTLEVDYRWENNAWTEFRKRESAYDNHGNLTMRADYGWRALSIYQKSEYVYDNHGNQTVRTTYQWQNNAWRLDRKTEYAYDSNGNTTLEIEYYWQNGWWLLRKDEYSYDSNGNQILQIIYIRRNNVWVEWLKREYTYDSNGNQTLMIMYEWINNAWRLDSKSEVAYDSNGNMTMEIRYEWVNNMWQGSGQPREYVYDSNGNLIMAIYYMWENNVRREDWKQEYAYDNNGNQIMYSSYTWENNAWIGSWKQEYAYDSNGNEILYIVYNWENNEWKENSKSKSEYTYDSNGNRTMVISYRWENNMWIESGKSEFAFDLSVSMSNVLFTEDSFFWITFANVRDGNNYFNKITGRKRYQWIENAWQESNTTTFYYSQLPTNIPNISTSSLSIFPNPVFENFTISGITENTFLQITDLNGRILLQQTVAPNEQISVGHLSAGVYFVRVNEETVKIVKR